VWLQKLKRKGGSRGGGGLRALNTGKKYGAEVARGDGESNATRNNPTEVHGGENGSGGSAVQRGPQ